MDMPEPMEKKSKPRCSVSWPDDGVDVKGLTGDIALGKTCTICVSGTIRAFRSDEYGGSMDLENPTVRVEDVAEQLDDAEEEAEDMIAIVTRLQGKRKGRKSEES